MDFLDLKETSMFLDTHGLVYVPCKDGTLDGSLEEHWDIKAGNKHTNEFSLHTLLFMENAQCLDVLCST